MTYWLANTRLGNIWSVILLTAISTWMIARWGSVRVGRWRLGRLLRRHGSIARDELAKDLRQVSNGVVAAPFLPLTMGVVVGAPVMSLVAVTGLFTLALVSLFFDLRDLLPPRWLQVHEGESWRDALDRASVDAIKSQ